MQTKYPNIFATGDCAENRTQRSLFSGLSQNCVVRHNVLQLLNGGELNAVYKGHSKIHLLEGIKKGMMWLRDTFEETSGVYVDNKTPLKFPLKQWKKIVEKKHPGVSDYTK